LGSVARHHGFHISWVNPDSRHRDKGFEAYMREGILAALDAIEKATGETKVSAIDALAAPCLP
jgi:polyhydroxyalkanoate synthase